MVADFVPEAPPSRCQRRNSPLKPAAPSSRRWSPKLLPKPAPPRDHVAGPSPPRRGHHAPALPPPALLPHTPTPPASIVAISSVPASNHCPADRRQATLFPL
ncbi:hypothetical protein J5N97_005382 [Dioscorea zingiberensis]|uniref:Uncharacterized protein n=1 Tax=Dioscorea zingiberensis TaxID=325984 RepID=A0A9D5D8G9_9LILI|nr:hypothetical protein J5N97_005382 [Dioscorea zingiberensis]